MENIANETVLDTLTSQQKSDFIFFVSMKLCETHRELLRIARAAGNKTAGELKSNEYDFSKLTADEKAFQYVSDAEIALREIQPLLVTLNEHFGIKAECTEKA